MKHFALVCLVLACSNLTAGEGNILFRSSAGFEVEIPKCWKPTLNSPDHDGPVESSPDVFFGEGKECQRPKLNEYVPNGISIASWSNLKSRDEIPKAIAARIAETAGVKSAPRENKANGTVEFQFVETPSKKSRRWTREIYCPNLNILTIRGPYIDHPSEQMLDRIKRGDLSAPEPEGTIMKSVKCAPLKKSKAKQFDLATA